MTLIHTDSAALEAVRRLQSYIAEELNVRQVTCALVSEVPHLVHFKCVPNHKVHSAMKFHQPSTGQPFCRSP